MPQAQNTRPPTEETGLPHIGATHLCGVWTGLCCQFPAKRVPQQASCTRGREGQTRDLLLPPPHHPEVVSSMLSEHLLPEAASVPPPPSGSSPGVADSPPDTMEAGAVSLGPRAQRRLGDWHQLQEDLRGVGGRPWTSQESENLSSRHHLVLYPVSLPQRRAFCSNGDSPAKQKSEKPVGQLCGFLKQVQQEWPRLGRLPSNLGQKGFLLVLEKANLVSLNPVPRICAPGRPTPLCALLPQRAARISSGGFTKPTSVSHE